MRDECIGLVRVPSMRLKRLLRAAGDLPAHTLILCVCCYISDVFFYICMGRELIFASDDLSETVLLNTYIYILCVCVCVMVWE